MKKYCSDKCCLSLLRVILFTFIVSLICAVKYYLYIFPLLMWIIIGLLSFTLFWTALIWMPLYFRNACYVVSSQEVIRCTGFFIRVRQVMKVSAIQYVALVLTPFSKVSGLNFVIVNALGGNLLLLFLSRQDAEEIAHTLTEAVNAHKK